MSKLTIPFLIVLLFMLTSYRQESKPVKKDLNKRIEGYIRKTMQVHGIPGVALAVIKEGKLIHKGYYGSASPEEEVSVGVNSLFRVYSTTKLITTVGIFQLIEKGKLSLKTGLLSGRIMESVFCPVLPPYGSMHREKGFLFHCFRAMTPWGP